MLPSIINIHQGIQKLWTGHDLHRQTDGQMDGRTDGWTDGRTDGQTDGRMDRRTEQYAGIYRWIPPDELWVSLSDILKRIPEPLPNGRSKRMFNIPETESVAIESKFGLLKLSKP
jgi:hypothetical protein